MPRWEPFLDRFFGNIEPSKGCWEWTACKLHGYGTIRVGNKNLRAHRLSYEIFYKQHPGDMHVCHHCDNPGCVNPEHLFLGTDQDNSNDKVAKGRQFKKTHCLRGHELKPENLINCKRWRQCRLCVKARKDEKCAGRVQ